MLFMLFMLTGCGWLGDASQTFREEIDPEVILKRYEWFKEASAQIEARSANIEMLRGQLRAIEVSYQGVPRSSWARSDAENYNTRSSELAGTIAGYNALVAEYNAQMAKANWAYCNGSNALPREYTEYKGGY